MIRQDSNVISFQESRELTYSYYNEGANPYVPVTYKNRFIRFDIHSEKAVFVEPSSLNAYFVNIETGEEIKIEDEFLRTLSYQNINGSQITQISYFGNTVQDGVDDGIYYVRIETNTFESSGNQLIYYSDDFCIDGIYGEEVGDPFIINYDTGSYFYKGVSLNFESAVGNMSISVDWGDGTSNQYSGTSIDAVKVFNGDFAGSILITGDFENVQEINFKDDTDSAEYNNVITGVSNFSAFEKATNLRYIRFIGHVPFEFGFQRLNYIDFRGIEPIETTELTVVLQYASGVIDCQLDSLSSNDTRNFKCFIDKCRNIDTLGNFISKMSSRSVTEFTCKRIGYNEISPLKNQSLVVVNLDDNDITWPPTLSLQYENIDSYSISGNTLTRIDTAILNKLLANGSFYDFSRNLIIEETVDNILSILATENKDLSSLTIKLDGLYPQNPSSKNSPPSDSYTYVEYSGSSNGWTEGDTVQNAGGDNAVVQITVDGNGSVVSALATSSSTGWSADEYITVANAHNAPTTLTSGSSALLKVSEVSGGQIVGLAVVWGGSGYVNGESFSVYGAQGGSIEIEILSTVQPGQVTSVGVTTSQDNQAYGRNAFIFPSFRYADFNVFTPKGYIESKGGTVIVNS